MKLTKTLYKRLADEAMEAAQISMERPKEGDKAWRKYKFDVYKDMRFLLILCIHQLILIIGHTKAKRTHQMARPK
ncbi:hypothetical protein [Limosilactobacillus reuteri]|uniref:hypothetical protein n=1 Tax=Limosilactobacillus reuteri TaxID=1598 RepID=UPI001E3B2E58|nr:hypothetical protein [Limosilactobacillus reuteri]MCC4502087.1 hypothetical protein [Limosilactobacillus reuteri]